MEEGTLDNCYTLVGRANVDGWGLNTVNTVHKYRDSHVSVEVVYLKNSLLQ